MHLERLGRWERLDRPRAKGLWGRLKEYKISEGVKKGIAGPGEGWKEGKGR
jgi:hypothetical protein